jgi:2-hydroxychromene-2-carboxylate isomerase
MATIEFFYDYASPFSYFADKQIRKVAERTGSELVYRPAVLGVLIVESNNTPPPAVPAKGSYYQVDMRRWSKRLDMPFKINPAFPVRSINLMRAALIAQDLDCFEAFHEAMWKAMWQDEKDLSQPEIIAAVCNEAGLDGEKIVAGTQDPAVKARLKENCDEAIARGAFGMPTFFVGDAMFFGNDRVDFVEEAIRDIAEAG